MALRKLISAELRTGNQIVEIASCFPAPPAGAYAKLAQAVTTRSKKSSSAVRYEDHSGSDYSGAFSDPRRFFFVLEPGRAPEPAPDMDAIRKAREASQRDADAALYRQQELDRLKAPKRRLRFSALPESDSAKSSPLDHSQPASLVGRFRESMVATYERWREGIGYDIALLSQATPLERAQIETLLLSRPIEDWRDVEALAQFDSARSQDKLRSALRASNRRVRIALVQYGAHVLSEAERIEILIDAIEHADTYGGLTQAMLEIEEYHPPPVVDALLRAVLRGGDKAIHFAALLMFVHGKAPCAFDWDQRPFFLQFRTEDAREMEGLFRELCERIGVAAEDYLRR